MKKLIVASLIPNTITTAMLAFLLWQVRGLKEEADGAYAKVDDVAAEVKSTAQFLESRGIHAPDGPGCACLPEAIP